MARFVTALIILCLQHVWYSQAVGMLSLKQQRLVSKFLASKSQAPEQGSTLLSAQHDNENVEAEVAMERSQFTETGESWREKELLTNIGHLEDQLEGYRQLGPNLNRHMQMQETTSHSLQALEAKTRRIEQTTANLWWDSKLLMCMIIIFGSALCAYVSWLHVRQNSQQSWQQPRPQKSEVAAPKDGLPDCEYFNLAEDMGYTKTIDATGDVKTIDGTGDAKTLEDWWVQPCGQRSGTWP